MKSLNYLLAMAMVVVLSFNLTAQDDSEEMAEKPEKPKKQLVNIHVDEVKPSMYLEYEKISKELVALCTKHGIDDVNSKIALI